MAKTYNPKRVVVTFCGQPITGFADGTFIDVEPTSDAFSTEVGADGEVARVASADQSATITVTLMQTSSSNDMLQAKHTEDRLTNLGTGPLMVKDLSGRSLVIAPEAWVQRAPSPGFGKETTPRVWVLSSGRVEIHNGGN